MVARSTRSKLRPDTLMQDRITDRSAKTSCDARPDHTLGQVLCRNGCACLIKCRLQHRNSRGVIKVRFSRRHSALLAGALTVPIIARAGARTVTGAIKK